MDNLDIARVVRLISLLPEWIGQNKSELCVYR